MTPPPRPRWAWLLTGTGWFCTGLGVAGIFIPLLPTVPLLLLAAACFARSSPRYYAWLLDHPRLGPLIVAYRAGDGIPLRAKVLAIASLWLSISLTLFVSSPSHGLRLALLGLAAAVTLYLLRQPTRRA